MGREDRQSAVQVAEELGCPGPDDDASVDLLDERARGLGELAASDPVHAVA